MRKWGSAQQLVHLSSGKRESKECFCAVLVKEGGKSWCCPRSNHGKHCSEDSPSVSFFFCFCGDGEATLIPGRVLSVLSSAHILSVPACLLAGLQTTRKAFLCHKAEIRNKVGLIHSKQNTCPSSRSFPKLRNGRTLYGPNWNLCFSPINIPFAVRRTLCKGNATIYKL